MKLLSIVLIVLVLLVVVIVVLKNRKTTTSVDEKWPFYAKKLLSAPEQILYFRLVKALPDHIVLGQVQLSRFLGVKKGENVMQWNNRINRMSVDFLVCSKDASVVAAIELDDKSHERKDRVMADAKKDKALNAANVKIIRWNVKTMPDESLIKQAFMPTPSTLEVNVTKAGLI